ncbi:hypothetical protein [Nostoc sp. TCL26-01]|uniref:Pepco domain-containing protein n=1 Tax=Nostoc sp. TCL26-01 TaxID=2576904 RepID=UPI0015BC1E9C|nr:hypothetical protein [Nostoc sp. TCL26-01]QLE58859.1 hypothetical protein FD725_27175 [Nostoc sp. TCL26-01]
METIPILVSLPSEDEATKNIFTSAAAIVLVDVPISILQDNLNKICEGVATLFQDVQAVGNVKLKEITVQVEVSAEGGIEIIGTGKLGSKGAITLTFSE